MLSFHCRFNLAGNPLAAKNVLRYHEHEPVRCPNSLTELILQPTPALNRFAPIVVPNAYTLVRESLYELLCELQVFGAVADETGVVLRRIAAGAPYESRLQNCLWDSTLQKEGPRQDTPR